MGDGIEPRVHELETGLTATKITVGQHAVKFEAIGDKFDAIGKHVEGIGRGLSSLRRTFIGGIVSIAVIVIAGVIVNGVVIKLLNGGGP